MRTYITIAASVGLLGVVASPASFAQGTASQQPGANAKMTKAECESMWNRMDSARAGSVSQAQAQPHLTDYVAADANKDAKLSQTEFLAACDNGLVRNSASMSSGSAGSGSSSGTGTGTGSSGAGTSKGTGPSGSDATKK
jgi:hypothetical protein